MKEDDVKMKTLRGACEGGRCAELDISLNDEHIGIIKRMTNNWKIDGAKDQKLVDAIGSQLDEWYK